jgi:hypothetical protein
MPKLQSRHRRVQFDLFQARVKRPDWQSLPLEIQEKTRRLLARLLRQHGLKMRANNRKAAGNE